MSQQRLCLIPEAGLNITPNGDITPCCIATDYKLGNIKTDSLSSIFYGKEYSSFRQAHRDGNLPKVCVKNCVEGKRDFVHVTSRNNVIRIIENQKHKRPDQEKLTILDVGLGNLCNLTCTFCNEDWSSSWAKLKNLPDKISYFDQTTTLGLVEDLKDLCFFSFKGGEPLNTPHLDLFLEELHNVIENKNCVITMISNCTETNERINESLFKFNVFMGVSTEAVGPLYQYLRGGKHTWESVVKNLNRFVELGVKGIHVSSILLLYNYTTWAEDMLKVQQDINNFTSNFGMNCQLCTHPPEQSVFLLNYDQRLRLVDSIRDAVDRGLQLQGHEEMITALQAGHKVDTTREKVLQSIEFNNKLRGVDLFSIVEDFTPYLDL